MSSRENALKEWLTGVLKSAYSLSPMTGDASFRRYFRVHTSRANYVLMDAPPELIPLQPFLEIAARLTQHGIYTPQIIASEIRQGFALLEDLGDALLFEQAHAPQAPTYYRKALDTLVKIQQCATHNPPLPLFDRAFMQQEMQLFQTWFLENWLDIQLSAAEKSSIQQSMHSLSIHLADQPQQFIHRDYHSRNLLIVNTQTEPLIGIIDFQDAMQGPWTYDLVSLIKDCYLNWPEQQQTEWMDYFYQQLPHQFGWSRSEFQQAVDWCGLQRHLKVLGIFCRLHLRDNKATYLQHLPLTLNHTMRCLARYDTFLPLYEFMQTRVLNPFKDKQPA